MAFLQPPNLDFLFANPTMPVNNGSNSVNRSLYHPKNARVPCPAAGLEMELNSPNLPLCFSCGNKGRPTTLNIRVSIFGNPVVRIQKVSLNVIIGDKINDTVHISYNNDKFIESTVKLSSGNELRPEKFKVTVWIQLHDGAGVIESVVKDAHCVLMTARCTQRRKATSTLAWQELTPFIRDAPKKSEKVCPLSEIKELLRYRWEHMAGFKRLIPNDFLTTLDDTTESSYFSKVFRHDERNPAYTTLTEREFRQVWSWYEANFEIIHEQLQTLFFNYNVPQIAGREEAQRILSSSPYPLTYLFRFASNEDYLSLSVYRKDTNEFKHFPVAVKDIITTLGNVVLLENKGYHYIGSKEIPKLSAVLETMVGKPVSKINYNSTSTEFFSVLSDVSPTNSPLPTPISHQQQQPISFPAPRSHLRSPVLSMQLGALSVQQQQQPVMIHPQVPTILTSGPTLEGSHDDFVSLEHTIVGKKQQLSPMQQENYGFPPAKRQLTPVYDIFNELNGDSNTLSPDLSLYSMETHPILNEPSDLWQQLTE